MSRRAALGAFAAVFVAAEPVALAKESRSIELTFVGDIIFGRYRSDGRWDAIAGLEEGQDPFDKVRDLLKADVVVGNLETPLASELPPTSGSRGRYRFAAPAEHADLLANAGFTALSLANNHAHDLGRVGAVETPAELRSRGIVPLGASRDDGPALRVETLEKAGWKIGFVAATTRRNGDQKAGVPVLPYVRTADLAGELLPLVKKARAGHDLVVVLMHWGDEYDDAPDHRQVRAAHAFVDAGADLVVGHHPHVLQGFERRGRGLVAYSLGNFLFENAHPIPRLGGILRTRFERSGGRACLADARVHPVYITGHPVKRPSPARGSIRKQIHERITETSSALKTRVIRDDRDLRIGTPACGPSVARR